jgi:hypothetical protein
MQHNDRLPRAKNLLPLSIGRQSTEGLMRVVRKSEGRENGPWSDTTMTQQFAWLKCYVSPGQFSEEFAVRASDYQGRQFSLFVNREFIAIDHEPTAAMEQRGQLKIRILEMKDALALVRLPSRTFENGSTVTVRQAELERAAEPAHP